MSEEPAVNPVRIMWLKWHDPFAAAMKEHREKGWTDGYEYMDRPGQAGAYQGPYMFGPAGIIPLNELNSPGRTFNLWVGHTSFDLDRPTLARMAKVPGVEVLRVWTRYRFWLGVAKAFEEERVKNAVFVAARPIIPPPAATVAAVKPSVLDGFRKHLAGKYRFWAVVEMPNGKLHPIGSDERATVEEQVAARKDVARQIFTSWEGCNGQ